MQAYKISLICLCLGQGFLWAWGRLDDIEQYLFHQMHFSPSSVSGTLHPIFLPPPPQILPTEYISHGGIWSVAYSIHVLVRVTNFKICKYERQRA